jgi:hypothetical protein
MIEVAMGKHDSLDPVVADDLRNSFHRSRVPFPGSRIDHYRPVACDNKYITIVTGTRQHVDGHLSKRRLNAYLVFPNNWNG